MNIKFFVFLFFILVKTASLFSSANSELIEYNTYCTIKNGKLSITREVLLQINNRAADKYTRIQIPFSKGDALKLKQAQIENLNGDVLRKFNKNQVQTRSAISDFSLYEDDYVKYFTLQHTQYPYRIRYKYEISYNHFLQIANWIPVLDTDIPTRSASLSVEVPNQYKIKINQKNIDDAIVRKLPEAIIYKWNSVYDSRLVNEIYSPPIIESLPRVQVIPQDFDYGLKGSFQSWESFGNWQYQLISGLNILPESDKNKIESIKKSCADTLSIIKELYKYLQAKTRYINVTIDIGGLKPYPAEYVSTKGYGDCKGLTNYMKSMLDYAGIKSNYSIVYAGNYPMKIDTDFPSQQFNHVILSIPFKKDTIWLECTSDVTPFNYLGTFTQNRKALVIEKNNSRLVNTPSLTMDEVFSSCTYKFDIDYLGHTKLNLNYDFNGPDFESFEHLRQQYTESEKEKILKTVFPLPSIRLHAWEIKRENTNEPKLNLISDLNILKYTRSYGDNIVFDLISSRIPVFEEPGERTLPVMIHYPLNRTDSLTYNFPTGYRVEAKPDNYIISSKYGSFSIKFMDKGEKLIVVREFKLDTGRYDLTEYPEFYEFFEKIYKLEKIKTIMITKI